jgi:hypothetical protein
MNRAGPAELGRRLFGSVRRERPSAELRARITMAGRAELERSRAASPIDSRRSLADSSVSLVPGTRFYRSVGLRRWRAVGVLLAAAGLIAYLGAGRAPESAVMISAEQTGSAGPMHPSETVRSASEGPPSRERVAGEPSTASSPAVPRDPEPPAPAVVLATPDTKAPPRAARPVPAAPRRAPAQDPEQPPQDSLAQQLEQIKAVRAALRAGEPQRALELIEAYRARGNGDKLAAEASLLRIEALAMSGQKAAATEAALEFANDYPNSPLIDRALSYAGSTKQ